MERKSDNIQFNFEQVSLESGQRLAIQEKARYVKHTEKQV